MPVPPALGDVGAAHLRPHPPRLNTLCAPLRPPRPLDASPLDIDGERAQILRGRSLALTLSCTRFMAAVAGAQGGKRVGAVRVLRHLFHARRRVAAVVRAAGGMGRELFGGGGEREEAVGLDGSGCGERVVRWW